MLKVSEDKELFASYFWWRDFYRPTHRQALKAEWSTLIGPDCPDTLLSLADIYHPDAKVYAITTHFKACKIC